MAGRRDFFKTLLGGAAAGAVAAKGIKAEQPEPPKPAEKFAMPPMPGYVFKMDPNLVCTTTCSVNFAIPQAYFPYPYTRARVQK
jgi:hypothetical protein